MLTQMRIPLAHQYSRSCAQLRQTRAQLTAPIYQHTKAETFVAKHFCTKPSGLAKAGKEREGGKKRGGEVSANQQCGYLCHLENTRVQQQDRRLRGPAAYVPSRT